MRPAIFISNTSDTMGIMDGFMLLGLVRFLP